MNNKITSALVLLCAIVCTIIVFHLVFDEHTKLFYINVVTTCVCEIILLANIPILSSTRLLTFKNAATSYVLDIYAVVLFLWTVVYSSFVKEEGDFNILYIGMLVLTGVGVVAFGMTSTGGRVMEAEQERNEAVAAYKRECLVSLDNFRQNVAELLAANGSEWNDSTLRLLNLVLDKIACIPSDKLDKNGGFVEETNRRLDEIGDLLRRVADGADMDDGIRTEVTRKIEQLKSYVTTMKLSL